MTGYMRLPLVGTLVASLAFVATSRAEAIKLRPRYREGQEFRFAIQKNLTEVVASTKIQGGQAQTGGEHELRVTVTVREVTPAGATAGVRFDAVRASRSGQGIPTISFDSATPPAQDAPDSVAAALRPLIGSVAVLRLSNTGEIMEVTPPALPAMSEEAAVLGNAFTTEEGIRGLFSGLFAPPGLPGALEVGAVWTEELRQPLHMRNEAKSTFTYTLDSADDSLAKISGVGIVVAAGPHGTAPIGARVTESENTSSIAWNLQDGFAQTIQTRSRNTIVADPQPGLTLTLTNIAFVGIERLP
ncbi:MAG TPA: hypothetical protein DEB06_03835 [Phycisphaerales bacterium]|nr:hypothetical protein [Phycisphaerales bacterium]